VADAAQATQRSSLEAVPPAASVLFGAALEPARRYAELLATVGAERGLIGPAEAVRIWSRHLLNSAAVAELFAPGSRVVDVGSGAGLPGVPIALCRPDLAIDLVEPLARRVTFLTEAVAELGLADRVRVVRGRAEDDAVRSAVGDAPWVTARAVAPLDRLVRWCLPLLAPGGRLALVKGASAAAELARHRSAVRRAGGIDPEVVHCGQGVVEPDVPVVVLRSAGGSGPASRRPAGRGGEEVR
jgi:16S rRNA (guanine527-N7)-methyltransferase